MSILKRVRDICFAGVHECLDKLEDPVSMTKQYIRDLEEEICKAERALSRQVLLEKRLEGLMAETTGLIEKRARQAQLAIETGEDNIAKMALQEKLLAEKKLDVYNRQYDTIKSQTAILVEQLQELKEKYLELENKKRVLMARANVAESIRNLNTSLVTIDTASAAKGFARMEERVLLMEADAEASMRIRQSYSGLASSSAESSLQDQVEEEFEKLKASVAK